MKNKKGKSRGRAKTFFKSKFSVAKRTLKNEFLEIGKSFACFGHIISDNFLYYVIRKKDAKKPEPLFFKGPTNLTFVLAIVAILAFGLVALFSASYVESYDENPTTEKVMTMQEDGTYVETEIKVKEAKGGYAMFLEQLGVALFGLAVMMAASHVRIDVYRKLAGFMFVISLLLLVYVLINPEIKDDKEDIKRWVNIFGISLQPSEIAKLTMILYMASIMERYQSYIKKSAWAIVPNAIPVFIVLALMIPESHNSGMVIIFAIGASMLFFGGIKMRWFIVGAGFVAVAVAGLYLYGIYLCEHEDAIVHYAQDRIAMWVKLLEGYDLTLAERTGDAWQSLQSLYAVGSGGLFGLGFGQSKQKHMYLPEPHNDFIFAVVCEELGFFRSVLVILAFLLIVFLGMYIATKARSKFAAMVAMGLSFKVGLQALLNFAVVTSMIPNTGISLPFFSSGGTALLLQLAEMGIILAVARESGKKGSYALQ